MKKFVLALFLGALILPTSVRGQTIECTGAITGIYSAPNGCWTVFYTSHCTIRVGDNPAIDLGTSYCTISTCDEVTFYVDCI